jgi:DUF4097 and DUF4098 domain-containing protein YvlB
MRSKQLILICLIVITVVMIRDVSQGGLSVIIDEIVQDLVKIDAQNRQDFASISSSITQSTEGIQHLVADSNSLGNIQIVGADAEIIEVDYVLTVYAERKKLAEEHEYMKSPGITLIKEGSKVLLSTEKLMPNRAGIHKVTLDYVIRVPRHIQVQIDNELSTISVSGIKNDVIVKSKSGSVILSDIEGAIQAEKTGSGPLRISNSVGNVNINGMSHVYVSSLLGDLILESRFANVVLEDISGSASVFTHYGSLRISKLKGNLDLQTGSTIVQGADIDGTIDIDAKYGRIDLSRIASETHVKTTQGNITLGLRDIEDGYSVAIRSLGKIDSDIPLTQKSEGDKSLVAEATGTFKNGKIPITLEADLGQVTLRIR